MDGMIVICSLVMGLCVAGITYFAGNAFGQFLDFVERDLADRLRSLRVFSTRLRRWIKIWMTIVAATFFLLWLGLDAVLLGACLAAILSAGPWYLIRRMAQQRRQKIEDQLADAMVMFSSAIRAGLSIAQALELLAMECPKPIKQEFSRLIGEYKMGKPLERALEEGKDRLKSENYVLFAAALLASRESGGRLNETVERISKSILEIQRLERKVTSETAQARKSAVYMAIAPALILIVYFFIDPVNTRLLFVTLPGQVMLAVAIVLNLIAYFWAQAILSPDI